MESLSLLNFRTAEFGSIFKVFLALLSSVVIVTKDGKIFLISTVSKLLSAVSDNFKSEPLYFVSRKFQFHCMLCSF